MKGNALRAVPLNPKPQPLIPLMQPIHGLSRRAAWAPGEPIASVLMAKTLARPDLVSLAAGFVDSETLPIETTRLALDAILSDPQRARASLQYGSTIGYPPLREAILERALRADRRSAGELSMSMDQVVVMPGSNQLLFLLGDVLMDPGDIVICTAPSYFVYLGTLANLGVKAVGVETDEQGIVPQAVDEELRRRKSAGELHRVKAVYVTSYSDNPSGVTLPIERRVELVELAKRWSRESRIYIIEDVAYRELRYYGEDLPSLRSMDASGETVIQAGTFSKSYSPGIRVGWGILPPDLLGPVLAEKGNLDFGSPNFNQLIMSAVLELRLFDEHVRRVQDKYREKLDAILQAADDFLAPLEGVRWVRPAGGLYVWLCLPEEFDAGIDGPLFDAAVGQGVLYVPGEYCYPAQGVPARKNTIRLSFGVQARPGLRRGVEALARAIESLPSQRSPLPLGEG
jgi:2-aminoadipate transaminase